MLQVKHTFPGYHSYRRDRLFIVIHLPCKVHDGLGRLYLHTSSYLRSRDVTPERYTKPPRPKYGPHPHHVKNSTAVEVFHHCESGYFFRFTLRGTKEPHKFSESPCIAWRRHYFPYDTTSLLCQEMIRQPPLWLPSFHFPHLLFPPR